MEIDVIASDGTVGTDVAVCIWLLVAVLLSIEEKEHGHMNVVPCLAGDVPSCIILHLCNTASYSAVPLIHLSL